MQITTLNKIIGLFLTGTFVLVIIFWGLYDRLQNTNLLQQGGLVSLGGSSGLLVVITFGLLSTVMLFGLVVDSLAELTTDRVLRGAKEWPFLIKVLALTSDATGYKYYREIVVAQFGEVEKYKNLVKADKREVLSFAVGLFFHNGNKENIEWVTQHISTYLLATNYLFTVLVIPLIFLLTGCPKAVCQHLLLTGSIYLVFVYALAHVTLSRFLFSYEVMLRDVALILSEEISNQGVKTGGGVID